MSSLQPEQIASVCHEANRAYCAAIGDDSQPSWADAPDWQKQSAIKGVEFTIANPDAGHSASHDSWLEEKTATGWKFGPVKDAEKKSIRASCLMKNCRKNKSAKMLYSKQLCER